MYSNAFEAGFYFCQRWTQGLKVIVLVKRSDLFIDVNGNADWSGLYGELIGKEAGSSEKLYGWFVFSCVFYIHKIHHSFMLALNKWLFFAYVIIFFIKEMSVIWLLYQRFMDW